MTNLLNLLSILWLLPRVGLPLLSANIRLGWSGLPVTNRLAYYALESKRFYFTNHHINTILSKFTIFVCKLDRFRVRYTNFHSYETVYLTYKRKFTRNFCPICSKLNLHLFKMHSSLIKQVHGSML